MKVEQRYLEIMALKIKEDVATSQVVPTATRSRMKQ